MNTAFYVILLLSLIPGFVFGQTIPTGVTITSEQVLELMTNVGGFLMVIGGILAGTVLIVAGLSYLLAGSDQTRVKTSKDILKAGMIGALIIFGFGTIINIVMNFGRNPFQFFN